MNKDHLVQQDYLVKADKLFLALLWLLFVVALGLTQLHDTLMLALLVGLPTVSYTHLTLPTTPYV